VARLLGAARDEIALTENATVAWQLAFYALAFQPGDKILTARAEYAANYVAFLQVAKRRTGTVIEVIPDDNEGVLDPAALERMIDDRAKLIAITWVPTNGGLRNPAAAVGWIARRHGITHLLDACRGGQMPTEVEELCCDILSAMGRKFLRGRAAPASCMCAANSCSGRESGRNP
jgi:selenocysteine lyase/cysteine desulfurase